MNDDKPADAQPTPVETEKHVETTEHTVERLEADVDNPGDHVTTHDEDDDPQSFAGEFQEDNN